MNAPLPKHPAILLCRCQYAEVIPADVREAVLKSLVEANYDFETVPDLCELSARNDPLLQHIASIGPVKIAACFPRAVKWLFAAGHAPLSPEKTEVVNLRTQTSEQAMAALRAPELQPNLPAGKVLLSKLPDDGLTAPTLSSDPIQNGSGAAVRQNDFETSTPTSWKPWFPLIDYDRCVNCLKCLSFCLFGVYGVDEQNRIRVQHPDHCKTGCPACSRVCPEMAIMFPKYKDGPINGEEINKSSLKQETNKINISELMGGDVYSLLRSRNKPTRTRFSKERDDEQALSERHKHLMALASDIPPEVLKDLPPREEMEQRAKAASDKTQAALNRKPQ